MNNLEEKRQKLRLQWLTTTNLYTKFFHMSTALKRRINSIESLKINSNHWTEDQNVIQNKFLEHFREIFQTSNPMIQSDLDDLFLEKKSEFDNQFLCKIPTEKEILSTLKQTPSTKALGPDGFTCLFYKHYWEIIKMDFNATIKKKFGLEKFLKK